MSSNDNGSSGGNEADAETNNTDRSQSAPSNPRPNESTASSSGGAVSESTNETSTTGSSSSSNNNNRPRVNPELENLFHARDLLEGISTRALARAARALHRNRASQQPSAASIAASEAGSLSPSSSPETSLEQRLVQRMQQRRERSRQREERDQQRRERSRQRRSRRRRRASSSEGEESAARRRRRAHNVVESLRELMLVPTSSTLGTEGETPRSDTNAEASVVRNANVARPGENQNENAGDSNGQGRETHNPASVDITNNNNNSNDNNNNNSDNDGDGDGNNFPNVFRSRTGRNSGEAVNNNNEGNNEDDESDDDSINVVDNLITEGFELGSLIDRDRILNNLMQRSIRMLRDVEGGSSVAQRTTDLKCPVCNEIFVDFEHSDHPNAPGNRASSTRCSHGALTLFTKLHQCPICFEENIEPPNVVALACGHVVCKEDFGKLGGHVGTNRPPGCPKAKPLPRRAEEDRRDGQQQAQRFAPFGDVFGW